MPFIAVRKPMPPYKGEIMFCPMMSSIWLQSILSHRCLLHPESALRGKSVNAILNEILDEAPLEIGEL